MDASRNPRSHTSEDGAVIAASHNADPDFVKRVISARQHDNGRGPWIWLRLSNGDLFLACAPKGATYELLEVEAAWPL